MSSVVINEIERNRSRLAYYTHAKEKSGAKKNPLFDKWIEIYSERVQKLERQLVRLAAAKDAKPGLRTASESAGSVKTSRSRAH